MTDAEKDFFACIAAAFPLPPDGADIAAHIEANFESVARQVIERQRAVAQLAMSETPEGAAIRQALTIKTYHGARVKALTEQERAREREAAKTWAVDLWR